MSQPLLSFKSVSLILDGPAGPVNILSDINFELAPGEAAALTGPSGAGKSSLMLLAAGLERPSAGEITLSGRALSALGEDGLARLRGEKIGIVFQDFHLLPAMTALENTAAPLELAGRADARERAAEILGRVGLSARLDHYPAQLSGGEQQRVALARALVARPSLLLADEPTGNLDGATGGRVIDLVFELAAETGAALLLITHDPALAARCGRRIALESGRIVTAAAPS
jgi:putative ABC transport system ATP-binding protein